MGHVGGAASAVQPSKATSIYWCQPVRNACTKRDAMPQKALRKQEERLGKRNARATVEERRSSAA